MSVRWRLSGELVCAALFDEETDDTYIDDRLHHQLAGRMRVLLPDVDHESNGLWHWVGDPAGAFLRAIPEKRLLATAPPAVGDAPAPALATGRAGGGLSDSATKAAP